MLLFTAVAVGGVTLAAPRAHALQGGEDPAMLPVLIDKRFGNSGVHQIGAQFSTALATKFIESSGAWVSYGYNFSDLFGLELSGAFFASRESNIMEEIRKSLPSGMAPSLTDLYQPVWVGSLNLMFVPLYGKISFASELDPAYDLFLTAGGGFGGLRRQVGEGDVKAYENTTSPTINFGLGLRFYFTRMFALRLEFRNFFYPDPDKDAGGLTHNLNFQGGLQLGFGG